MPLPRGAPPPQYLVGVPVRSAGLTSGPPRANSSAAVSEHPGGVGEAASGRLNAGVARAVVRIHNEYRGRGPSRAHAFFRHDVLVVVMENTMTQAERSLCADGNSEMVLEVRHQLQRTMRVAMVPAIETLTGCRVRAFMSANHIEPDFASEIFVLDRPIFSEQLT
jgi:uncharacterized protein YbcI